MCFLILSLLLFVKTSQTIELTAHFSENGVHGFVAFSQDENIVHIVSKLNTQSEWNWLVKELPVDYSELEDRCSDRRLGKTIMDLSASMGTLNNSTPAQTSRSDLIPLTGQNGIWSRSLVLESSGVRACSSIVASGNSSVKVAQAVFPGENGISGKVLVQWFGSSISSDAVIYTNLYYPSSKRKRTQHEWRMYTTDILDSEADKARSNCNSLQVIEIDLTARLDKVSVGQRSLIRDPTFPHAHIGDPNRYHYLVLLDNEHPDTFIGCARVFIQPPNLLKGIINSHGVSGLISMEQNSPLTPTRVVLNITRVMEPILGGFRVHELPPIPPLGNSKNREECKGIGEVYNPHHKGVGGDAPFPGEESQDKYAVGDLSGKLGYASEREWDSFLPLFGKHSVAMRSVAIYKNGENGIEEPWICSVLTRYQSHNPDHKVPMFTAEALYRYPLVGRITFFQPEPQGETTILVEGLVHADGTSLNTTKEHRWGIHVNPPGKDFFNWTARCVSAGPVFNPYQVDVNKSAESVLGSLSSRLDHLLIAGSKKVIQESRKIFIDEHISLSGLNSIYGKSLVIFDDFGPTARGERLACSKILGVFRRKAVARDWFGNGVPIGLTGKVEFLQHSEYSLTDIELNLEGLKDVGDYQIHMTPVLEILEFPCEESTLYGVFNPYETQEVKITGTPDQYRVGDISGKFGKLTGQISFQKIGYNDTNLMIFGQKSILGRSMVLHSAYQTKRLACSTIERGYSPSEARELRAIASFHRPDGYAHGYIRMTQLIHNDGSSSDTVIEVNLRHPGKNDRNMTRNHNWAIYVNGVGVDAAVKVENVRCTAAGYIWNPYYTQLADPLNEDLYKQECGPDLPLRCYVGDLSGRLGTIDLGVDRMVFSDPNFPLEGAVSAMGRSIVIFDKEGGSYKYACANIEPDYDTVKYVNVRKPPKFTVSQFLDDVRTVMGIPEWFLTVDTRKTNVLYNGACIQLLVHFKGPQANKLEQDFSRLLSTGKLHSPSLFIPGYIPSKKRRSSISYKICSSVPNNDKSFTLFRPSSASHLNPSLLNYVLVSVLVLLLKPL